MEQTIYKVIVYYDAEHIIDSTIFWDRIAAIREAHRIYDDCEIDSDIVYVYKEEADKDSGAFVTTERVLKLTKEVQP